MRPTSWVLSLVVALLPACKKVEYVYLCDADITTDAPDEDDAAVDALAGADAPADALGCARSGDQASSLVQVGGLGGPAPQLTVDGFGAAASYAASAGGVLVQLGANGLRRAADLVLPSPPVAIGFDGASYWIVENVATSVQVRSVSPAGVLGTPIAIGTGRGVPGALAVHASGDVAMLWVSGTDGSLRATLVPTTGSPVETELDPRPFVVNVQVIGGIAALTGTGAKFLAAFERHAGGLFASDVRVVPLGPTGTAQSIAVGGAVDPTRVSVAPGPSAGTALVTWRETNDVHAAISDATGAAVLADTVVITATGLTRVAGRTTIDGGFDVLVDHTFSASDRAIEQTGFDATGAQVGATRRIATICANSFSEDNLPFVRNTSVRYATWYDLSLTSHVTATF